MFRQFFSNKHDKLLIAAESGDNLQVRALLEKKANIHHTNKTGDTALHLASRKGHTVVVNTLLERKPNLEIKNTAGQTPLLKTIWDSRPAVNPAIDLLLEAKADINAQDNNGFSPLYMAALKGSTPFIAKILDIPGIDLTLKTKETKLLPSETALEYTQRIEFYDAIDKFEIKLSEHQSPTISLKERLEKIDYKGEIPQPYLCPLSQRIINDPVTVSSGIVFDRVAIKDFFAQQNNPRYLNCPVTGKEIARRDLYNKTTWGFKTLLDDFVMSKVKEYEAQNNRPLTQEMEAKPFRP